MSKAVDPYDTPEVRRLSPEDREENFKPPSPRELRIAVMIYGSRYRYDLDRQGKTAAEAFKQAEQRVRDYEIAFAKTVIRAIAGDVRAPVASSPAEGAALARMARAVGSLTEALDQWKVDIVKRRRRE